MTNATNWWSKNGVTGVTDRIARRITTIAAAKPVAADPAPRNPVTNRTELRQPVFRQGRLTVTGGVKLDCIIVDLSENGAGVELNGASALPDLVTLKILVTGESRRARVVWRRGNAAGLSFQVERQNPFGAARKAQ
jgi:hypothetical protein